MLNLENLLQALAELGVEPRQIRIRGQLFGSMLSEAEDVIEEDSEEDE